MKFRANGWINNLSWSPNAAEICYVTHDCEVNFAEAIPKDKNEDDDKDDKVRMFHHGNPHTTC